MAISLLSVLSGLSLVAFNNDGSVDTDSTNLNIQLHLQGELDSRREVNAQIEQELDLFFNSKVSDPNRGVPTGMVTNQVAMNLSGGDLDKGMEIAALVEEFIKTSPRFESRRGRNGGLFRVG